MTDTPAEVAEALARMHTSYALIPSNNKDDYSMEVLAEDYVVVRGRISYLERQLAEARAERERIVAVLGCHPAFLLAELEAQVCRANSTPNADDYRQLQQRAESAEAQLAAQRERDGRDAERFRYVITHGKLPLRCTSGYYYEDGLLYPTPEAAIDAALKDRP